jgi:hypothetical protein
MPPPAIAARRVIEKRMKTLPFCFATPSPGALVQIHRIGQAAFQDGTDFIGHFVVCRFWMGAAASSHETAAEAAARSRCPVLQLPCRCGIYADTP